MTFVTGIADTLARVCAGKFSLLCVMGAAAAGSVALFVTHEQQSFDNWASAHYGKDAVALAANKTVKLPPLENAIPMSRIVHTADDDFARSLQNGRAFRRNKNSGNSSKYIRKVKRSNLIGRGASDLFSDPFSSGSFGGSATRRISQSGLFRTMCVRSCDGFMWPVSFSTTKRNFRVDANICRSSCAAPTRLYFYENPGQEPKDMIDARGRSYNTLPTAWRFQQQHVGSCKCRPDPWEPQALARHTKYAKLKQEGRLDRYLKRASRKIRRNSRRASIGHVTLNSSASFATASVSSEKSKSKPARKIKTRSKPRRQKRSASASFRKAQGFSNKSYKAKSFSRRRSKQIFRNAFGQDR